MVFLASVPRRMDRFHNLSVISCTSLKSVQLLKKEKIAEYIKKNKYNTINKKAKTQYFEEATKDGELIVQ